jgi:hypothetical protein
MSQQPLAYLDPEFLESEEGRPVRILSEYLDPLKRFKDQKIQDTVVFFGSARVDSREGAERALKTLRARGVQDADEHYQLELKKSRKAVEWARFYEARPQATVVGMHRVGAEVFVLEKAVFVRGVAVGVAVAGRDRYREIHRRRLPDPACTEQGDALSIDFEPPGELLPRQLGSPPGSEVLEERERVESDPPVPIVVGHRVSLLHGAGAVVVLP